jgi:hypothetical protein
MRTPRRRLALAALVAALASLGPVAAAPAGAKAALKTVPKHLPVVGSFTLLFAAGTGSADVTVPPGVSLVVPVPTATSAPGFALLGDGSTWAAVALVSLGSRYGGRPVHAVQVHTPTPDHCAATSLPPPVAGPPRCPGLPFAEHTYFVMPSVRRVGNSYLYALPPGTYRIVVSGPPGHFMMASLSFAGAGRPVAVAATRTATAAFASGRVEDPALARMSGTYLRKMTAPGIGVVGLWHTSAGDEAGEFSYAECVTAGAAAPANPDDCTPLALTGVPAGVPDTVAKKPVFFAASYGGITATNSGLGTFETPLAAGTYTNSFRVTRGGRGPAVGTFAWWLQDDALR